MIDNLNKIEILAIGMFILIGLFTIANTTVQSLFATQFFPIVNEQINSNNSTSDKKSILNDSQVDPGPQGDPDDFIRDDDGIRDPDEL